MSEVPQVPVPPQQQLRNLRERFLLGYQNPDGNLHEMNQMAGQGIFPQRHQDPESGQIAIQTLHGGSYPSAILSQSDLHHNLRRNIKRSTLERGSKRLSSTPKNSPASAPGRWINPTPFTRESSSPSARPGQSSPIAPKPEPISSNSSKATKRRICRGRARHLRSDRDIELIAESSIQLHSMSSILQENSDPYYCQTSALLRPINGQIDRRIKRLGADYPKMKIKNKDKKITKTIFQIYFQYLYML